MKTEKPFDVNAFLEKFRSKMRTRDTKPTKPTILYPSWGEKWLDTQWFDSDVEIKFYKWEDIA